ncbi:trypsin-like peptidase domain-containing protein [Kitasatospora sp. NPDC052896]|uniref:nSTAND1 domain-containing NTPase n=1 Tax=Kitasatospora sp. NPDC052896 TaxID=3364061 RepID=UPI0037CB37ED
MTTAPAVAGGTGPKALDAAVLRIRNAAGVPVGLGFLVTDELALTCAHVVSAALGTPPEAVPSDAAGLTVDPPLLPFPTPSTAAVTVRIEHWAPAEDVAVLRLSDRLPGARPVRLLETREVWGHAARAFGFPIGRSGGVWHAGVLRERQADGLLQLDQAGTDGYRVSGGFSGGPVWDDVLVGVIGMMALAETGDPPVSYLIPTQRLLEAWPELRGFALPPSPFRSLTAFGESDASIFYGRRTEADELSHRLLQKRWVAVVGASGSGKSSLAMAGVIPRFREAGNSAVVFRPSTGGSPLSALAAALLPLLEPRLSEVERLARIPELTGALANGQGGLADVVARILSRHGSGKLLIVVDQFEELLSRTPEAVDALAGVLFDENLPSTVRVLTTLRADFLETVLEHPRLGPFFAGQNHALAPMRAERFREIVTAPVDAVPGVSYAPGLVERILDDTRTEPGALPLLGFTLELLWRRQTGGQLTHQAYEELGGVAGALSAYADRVWDESVLPGDEAAARQLFTQLIRVPMGSTGATRRTVRRTELSDDEWRIARQLATTRLLVTGRIEEHAPAAGSTDTADSTATAEAAAETVETVELAHEALINSWPRLADWAVKDRSFLGWRESLRHDRDRWEAAGRTADLLPTAVTLAGAQRWLGEYGSHLTEPERDYLRRGHVRRRRLTRRRRAAVALVGVLALVAASVSAVSLQLSRETARKDAVSRSTTLAADANALSATDPGVAAQLAIAAYRSAPTQDAANQLYATLMTPLDSVVGDTGHEVLRIAAQPDGPLAAAVDKDGSLRIWNLTKPLAPVLDATLHTAASGIALAPRGGVLAGACPTAPSLCLWSLADPRHPTVAGELPGATDLPRGSGSLRVTSMAFSPDGTLLAAALEQGVSLVWSVAQAGHPRLVAELPTPTQRTDGVLAGVAFAPKGDLLATTILGGTTQLWNLADPATPAKVATMSTGYTAVAFSPDGSRLAAVGDFNVGLWNIGNPSTPAPIPTGYEPSPVMMAVAFSPDGSELAFSGLDETDSNGQLCLLDLSPATPASVQPTCATTGFGIISQAYTPDGVLLSGGPDGVLRAWRSPLRPADDVTASDASSNWDFSPDGRLMVAALASESGDDALSPSHLALWDISAPRAPARIATITLPATVQQVRFLSPTALLTVAHDESVQLWDLRDPHHPVQAGSLGRADFPTINGGAITGTGVDADTAGDLVAVQGSDKLLHLWQITDSHHAAEVGSVPVPDPDTDETGVLADGRTAIVITPTGIDWWDTSNPRHPVHGDTTQLTSASPAAVSAGAVLAVVTSSPSDDNGSGTVHLFHVTAGRVRSATVLPGSVGSTLNMSPDGRRLAATGPGNSTVTVWDISDPSHPRTGAAVSTLHDLHGVSLDPTGHLMAVWNGMSGEAQLWDIRNPSVPVLEATITFTADNMLGPVTFLSSAPTFAILDGRSAFLTDTDPGGLADLLCSYTGNSITAAQWQKDAPGTTYRKACP